MRELTSAEIDNIRWHASRGVKASTLAQWFGIKAMEVRAIIEMAPSGAPAAEEDQPHSAGTATAEPEETGHRPQGSDEVPPLREVDGPQPSAKHSGQSDRPTILFFEPAQRTPMRRPVTAPVVIPMDPVDRRTLRRKPISPGFVAAPARLCQWIEGDPTPDDSCKCLAPSAPGVSYCPAHAQRAYRVLPRGVAAAFPTISPTP